MRTYIRALANQKHRKKDYGMQHLYLFTDKRYISEGVEGFISWQIKVKCIKIYIKQIYTAKPEDSVHY